MPNAFGSWRLRAALAAVALAVAGCAAPDDRTPQERATDQAIGRQVEAALNADPYVNSDYVTVEVRRGVVSLSGKVRDDADLRRMLRLCSAVPGVRGVDEGLEIIDFGEAGGGDHPTQ